MRTSLMMLLALVSTASAQVPSNDDQSRDWVNKGIQAYKQAKYTEAAADFQKALELNPDSVNARLYLATSYMSQYIPGAASPGNLELAQNAAVEFGKVLERDPRNAIAVSSLASLYYQRATGEADLDAKIRLLDKAQEFQQKAADINPQNKDAHCTIGVIEWAKCYPRVTTARARLGMKPATRAPIADTTIRAELRSQCALDNGMDHLKRALEIDPEYPDAMAYMNLLLRLRADLADSTEDYARYTAEADDWVQRALEAKKKLQARPQP